MKGAFYIQQWFALLGAGVLAAILPLIITSQFLKISPEVEKNEFENKAILLANVLMSNPDLIYSNNRGMFDKGELDKNMIEKGGSLKICKDPTCPLYSYPESFGLVVIKNTDNPKVWVSIILPKSPSQQFASEITKCLTDKVQQLFDLKDKEDISSSIENCNFQRNSHIFNKQGFSISIMSDPTKNKIDMGWMKVMVVE